MNLQAVPLHKDFSLEVQGVDLSEPLSEEVSDTFVLAVGTQVGDEGVVVQLQHHPLDPLHTPGQRLRRRESVRHVPRADKDGR